MVECVGRDGYEGTTVPQVVATARVSRNAFYEFFADKADCFIAVCDQTAEELLAELVELVAEPDWITAICKGMRRYLRWWQERPTISSAYLLSLPAVGERARRGGGVWARGASWFCSCWAMGRSRRERIERRTRRLGGGEGGCDATADAASSCGLVTQTAQGYGMKGGDLAPMRHSVPI